MPFRSLLLLSIAALVACNSGEKKQTLTTCDMDGCPIDMICGAEGTCVPAIANIPDEDDPAVDPCASATCDALATCDSRTGQAVCTCPIGYEDTNADGTLCTDIDECLGDIPVCGANATCTNVPGSFTCACAAGYEGNPVTGCTNIDECKGATPVCGPNATCTDEIGSFTCTCAGGYKGDPYDLASGCADVNECGAAVCGANAICTNTTGSFTCACAKGFDGDPLRGCTDIDECALGTDDCDANAACGNTTGAFTCACNRGWTGSGKVCTDVDECLTRNGGCSANAACQNTPGSRTCTCNGGFSGDGLTCTDIDECALGTDRCDDAPVALCTNTTGSHTCTCPGGYFDSRSGGAVCLPTGDGHVVLVAHGFTNYDVALPLRPVLRNTVALGHVRQRIGYLVEFARFGTPEADIPLRVLGLSPGEVKPLGLGDLANNLYAIDVLIVPDQAAAAAGQMQANGTKLRTPLQNFVYGGGVILVLDGRGDTAGLVRGAGLVEATLDPKTVVLPVRILSDEVTVGLSSVPTNGGHFATGDATYTTDGREVVLGSTTLDNAIVVHKKFHPIGDFELARAAAPGPEWVSIGRGGGRSDESLRLHGGLGWQESDWYLNPTQIWGSTELPGDRVVIWFRPTNDAVVVDLGIHDNGKSALVVRATASGIQAFSTTDHVRFAAVSSLAAGRVTLGAWHRLEVRWDPQRAIAVARLRSSTNTLLAETSFKLQGAPAGVAFAVHAADVDSLIGSAESR